MPKRQLVIGGVVVLVLAGALAAYFVLRPPFAIHSSRVAAEIPGVPGFGNAYRPAGSGQEFLIVTVKINRDDARRASDFSLRLPDRSETVQCTGICPVDDPEHPGGIWMVAAREGEDVTASSGFGTGYLHLAFVVPRGTTIGSLSYRETPVGSVTVRR